MRMNQLITLVCSFVMACGILSAQPSAFYDGHIPNPNVTAFLKHVDIPVNLSRGLPQIGVPIHTMQHGDISIPISLSYNASGIKANESASWVGMNWSLQAGGAIYRSVKGIPDELSGGYFATANNGGFNSFGEPDEFTVEQISNGNWDGEPDLFSFSFAGYSGKFYINSQQEVILIPKQDLVVTYDFDGLAPTDERLHSFTIITPQGITYSFGKNDAGDFISDYARIETSAGTGFNPNSEAPVSWHLTKIESSTTDNVFFFDYQKQAYRYSTPYSNFDGEFVSASKTGVQFSSHPSNIGQDLEHDATNYVLSRIYGSLTNEEVHFEANTSRTDVQQVSTEPDAKRLDAIEVQFSGSSFCKRFDLRYDHYEAAGFVAGNSPYYEHRLRLTEVQESACDGSVSKNPFRFEYSSDELPPTTTRAIDHWGFYNGQTGNAYQMGTHLVNIPPTTLQAGSYSKTIGNSNRNTYEAFMKLGILEIVHVPNGGYQDFDYEANQYHDPNTGVQLCGGLRIKTITIDTDDGINPPIVKQYSYLNPNTGNPSGALVQTPSYGLSRTQEVVKNCFGSGTANCSKFITLLMWNDAGFFPLQSFEGYHILYGHVTETRSDGASSQYTYKTYTSPQPNAGAYPRIPYLFDADAGVLSQKKHLNNTAGIVQQTVQDYEVSLVAEPETLVRAQGYQVSFSYGIDCCSAVSEAMFFHSTYKNYTGYALLERVETITDGVKTIKVTEYDPTKRFLFPVKQKTWSNGRLFEAHYSYPHDYTTGSIRDALLDQNRIGSPWKTENYVDGVLLSGQYADWSFYLPNNGYHTTTPTAYLFPKDIYDFERTWDANGTLQTGSWVLNRTNQKYHYSPGLPMVYDILEWSSVSDDFNNEAVLTSRTFLNHTSSYSYYPNTDLPQQIINIDGTSNSFTLDGLWRIKTTTDDCRGVVTGYDYHYKNQPLGVIGGSVDKSFIKTTQTFPIVAGSDLSTLIQYDYVDGLGRPIATVKRDQAPNQLNDIIISTRYDALGRPWKTYEPTTYPSSANNGKFYDDSASAKYTETLYYSDPLNRVASVRPPDWHTTTYSYGSNTSTITDPEGSSYGTDTLSVVTVTDPNGNIVRSYSDQRGLTILEEVTDGASASVNTFSCYDDKDRIRVIYPPGSTPSTPDLLTKYVYDGANNMTVRDVPDAMPIAYVYNDRHLVAGMQNAVLLQQGKWQVTQFDGYGRPTQGGLFSGASIANPNTPIISTLLEETWYDGFDGSSTQSGAQYIGKARKNRVKRLDDNSANSDFLETTMEYDLCGRVSTATGNNHTQLGNGSEIVSFTYDSADNLLSENRNHAGPEGSKTIDMRMTYDYLGRTSETFLNYEGNGEERLSRKDYTAKNELATLRYGKTGSLSLYQLNYSYNAQGWMTRINSPLSGSQTDFFCDNGNPPSGVQQTPSGMFYLKLHYDTNVANMPHGAQLNGNIAAMEWQVPYRRKRGYSFDYDYQNRLTAAVSGEDDIGNWENSDFYSTSYAYDDRGNLLQLTRNQQSTYMVNGCYAPEPMDNLGYTYQPGTNQIKHISDTAPCPEEYTLPDTIRRDATFYGKKLIVEHTSIDHRAIVDMYALDGVDVRDSLKIMQWMTGTPQAQTVQPGCTTTNNSSHVDGFAYTNSTDDYVFDSGGNLTHDPNKRFDILYNHLNLPYKYVSTGSIPEEVQLEYDATGNLLYRSYYRDGQLVSRRDFLSGLEYKNGVFDNLQHEVGRVIKTESGSLETQFYIKDHLSNIRVVFADTNKDGSITYGFNGPYELREIKHYYPFGHPMRGTWQITNTETPNHYGYSSNEVIQEMDLGIMDFKNRQYATSWRGFLQVDPLADAPLNIGTSPYAYVWNNPVRFIDPDGRHGESIHKDKYGNVIAEYDDGDNNVYVHNDLGDNQHIDGMRAAVDQRREFTGSTSGGGEKQFWASLGNKIDKFINGQGGGFHYEREDGRGYQESSRRGDSTAETIDPPGSNRGYNKLDGSGTTGNSQSVSGGTVEPPMKYKGSEFYGVGAVPEVGKNIDTVVGGQRLYSNGFRDSVAPIYFERKRVFKNPSSSKYESKQID